MDDYIGKIELHNDQDLLHKIVDAWEALPGGRQVNTKDVERWLAKDMSPMINQIRAHLNRPLPSY